MSTLENGPLMMATYLMEGEARRDRSEERLFERLHSPAQRSGTCALLLCQASLYPVLSFSLISICLSLSLSGSGLTAPRSAPAPAPERCQDQYSGGLGFAVRVSGFGFRSEEGLFERLHRPA